VDFKRVTVFIGPTGGGKSTLAKLAALFRNQIKHHGPIHPENLKSFGFLSYWINSSRVTWRTTQYEGIQAAIHKDNDIISLLDIQPNSDDLIMWLDEHEETLKSKILTKLKTDRHAKFRLEYLMEPNEVEDYVSSIESNIIKKLSSLVKITVAHYLPAERVSVPTIEYSQGDAAWVNDAIPKFIRFFVKKFSEAREHVTDLPIKFLDVAYSYRFGQDFIQIPQSQSSFRLYETASGIQSVTPLLVLLDYLSKNDEQVQSFIIEEPELNLYPTAQQGLLNWLVEKCTKSENDLTITTHSPYILSSCNLLLEAYKVAKQRPELADEINNIVPRAYWLNPEEFAAYYVADGMVKPITDTRTHLIGSNELDAVSGDISDRFRQLLRLQKQKPTSV
jgi:predicted ATPase